MDPSRGLVAAFSTSSPVASVALFEEGRLAWSAQEEAPRAASGAVLAMLEQSGVRLAQVNGYLADVGPGSLIGLRVGVVLAKTFASTFGVPCGGGDAFDLIAPEETVVFPNRRTDWFVRSPGQAARIVDAVPEGSFVGNRIPGREDKWPLAERFGALLAQIEWTDGARFRPEYAVEPSISTPKRPFGAPA